VVSSGYSLLGCIVGYLVGTIGFGAAAIFLVGPDLKSTIRSSLTATLHAARPARS
jgi:hypothetical protein